MKRMKSERSGARKRAAKQAPDLLNSGDFGQIPPEAIPATPIPAEDTLALARNGIEVNRGNSNQQPLSDAGQMAADDTAAGLAAHGGLDTLKASAAARSMQTAQAVAASDPKAPKVQPDPNLESWAQGNLEGRPAKPIKKLIDQLVRKNPDYRIPGQGSMSSRQGESFDEFRLRVLPRIRAAMQELALDPSKTIGIVLHSQVIRLVEAWIAEGCPDDFSVNAKTFLKPTVDAPGSVERLYPEKSGDWKTEPVDVKAEGSLLPGSIYLIRHGMTASNKENYEHVSNSAAAQSQLAKQVKSLDFGRARSTAKTARDAGHLSDEEISKIIGDNLPKPEDAEKLPNHHLLAVASAAGPRRGQYAPAVASRFSPEALSQLQPDAQAALRSHLTMLGLHGGPTK